VRGSLEDGTHQQAWKRTSKRSNSEPRPASTGKQTRTDHPGIPFPLAMPPAKKEHPKAPGSNPIDWTMAPSWHHFPDPDPQARLFFLRDLPVIDTLRRVSIASCGGKQ